MKKFVFSFLLLSACQTTAPDPVVVYREKKPDTSVVVCFSGGKEVARACATGAVSAPNALRFKDKDGNGVAVIGECVVLEDVECPAPQPPQAQAQPQPVGPPTPEKK